MKFGAIKDSVVMAVSLAYHVIPDFVFMGRTIFACNSEASYSWDDSVPVNDTEVVLVVQSERFKALHEGVVTQDITKTVFLG